VPAAAIIASCAAFTILALRSAACESESPIPILHQKLLHD
jgi:hypothetical protein